MKNSFNILWKKIYLNFLIKKNIQLLIRILFHEKFIQYTSEKNLSEFYFTKKILRLFIGFTMSHFTRNILLIEIRHAKFFNFRIKIIFRDKILY